MDNGLLYSPALLLLRSVCSVSLIQIHGFIRVQCPYGNRRAGGQSERRISSSVVVVLAWTISAASVPQCVIGLRCRSLAGVWLMFGWQRCGPKRHAGKLVSFHAHYQMLHRRQQRVSRSLIIRVANCWGTMDATYPPSRVKNNRGTASAAVTLRIFGSNSSTGGFPAAFRCIKKAGGHNGEAKPKVN